MFSQCSNTCILGEDLKESRLLPPSSSQDSVADVSTVQYLENEAFSSSLKAFSSVLEWTTKKAEELLTESLDGKVILLPPVTDYVKILTNQVEIPAPNASLPSIFQTQRQKMSCCWAGMSIGHTRLGSRSVDLTTPWVLIVEVCLYTNQSWFVNHDWVAPMCSRNPTHKNPIRLSSLWFQHSVLCSPGLAQNWSWSKQLPTQRSPYIAGRRELQSLQTSGRWFIVSSCRRTNTTATFLWHKDITKQFWITEWRSMCLALGHHLLWLPMVLDEPPETALRSAVVILSHLWEDISI